MVILRLSLSFSDCSISLTLISRFSSMLTNIQVIMACRDIDKTHIAVNDIKKEVKDADIVVKRLDLSSLTSVKQCAKEIVQEVDKIDILINNAGVMWTPKWLTEDGFEMQFGTNHLGISFSIVIKLIIVNKNFFSVLFIIKTVI